MNINLALNDLFCNLKNRNKWDSWTFIFRLFDGGHCKLKDIYEKGDIYSYSKELIDIRRMQYLDTMSDVQKRRKKSIANKRLKTELKLFLSN